MPSDANDIPTNGHDVPSGGAELPTGGAPADARGGEQRPATIGPFTVLEYLGEGGFGIVYLAEQHQPIRRKVALKLIKPGMDTRAVIARFDAERQALAMMSHPGIARVLEAGATEHGRPYFVMEYVRGERITAFCEKRELPLEGRLALMITVCEAVHHAHTRGIIHRDLKPSNILVQAENDHPTCKIIDFGIAKALHQPLTDHPEHTFIGQILGTRQYMAPEQADTESPDVDTRSDVYSLGAILYELLTGVTPNDPETLRTADPARLYTLLQARAPVRPSRRAIEESRAGADGAPNAPAIPQRLSRELDWIVLKCLESERGRRYPSANALAEDLRRVLEDQPVVAAPPSRMYRARKAIRRHRAAFAAGVVVASALVIATGVSLVFAAVASHQRDRARAQSAVKEQVLEFFTEHVLNEAAPGRLGPDASIERLIASASGSVREQRDELAPEARQSIHATLGETYFLMGDLERAGVEIAEGLALAREWFAEDDERTLTALNDLAVVRAESGDFEGAREIYAELIPLQERVLGEGHEDTVRTVSNLSVVLTLAGRPEEAAAYSERAIEGWARALGPDAPDTLISRSNHAELLLGLGRLDQAERHARRALEGHLRVSDANAPGAIHARKVLAKILADGGDIDAARAVYAEAIEASLQTFGEVHPATASLRMNLGEDLLDAGDTEAALASLRAALDAYERMDDQRRAARAREALQRAEAGAAE
jgi:serine/threonine protein kinase/tetratricopeptide (TPR) repeat protein